VGSNTRPPNKYTKELREVVGRDKPCEGECTWWDPKGRCVMCGKPRVEGYGRIELRRTVGLVGKDGQDANYDYPAIQSGCNGIGDEFGGRDYD
jgi:hypothetical protein